jgi:2'-5' RNA ligase
MCTPHHQRSPSRPLNVDRWQGRLEPGPEQGRLYWHVLFRDHPQVHALAGIGQRRLASLPGLHLVPQEWLHMTALVVGTTEETTGDQVEAMTAEARRLLAERPPITVTLGRVLYHPQAIMLGVQPRHALHALLDALQNATRAATGKDGVIEHRPWTPHVTLAYNSAAQPAAPIIDALGPELPSCEVTIRTVDLVDQNGPERLWNWRSIAAVPLGTERDT